MFAGHFPKWLLATPDGIDVWRGDRKVSMNAGRFVGVVGALCDDHYAILRWRFGRVDAV
jgi:hypothetical protein